MLEPGGSAGQVTATWAATLIDGLVRAGVGHAVLSPGSRSTPLTLACLRHPGLTSRLLLDERAAAFYALGLARAEGRPVILICTSGSAVANWHPAVVEADAARLPLLLLTADRPPELQDCGANQTLDQRTLFGPQVRAVHTLPPAEPAPGWLVSLAARVVSQSLWPLAGPVQINVPLREPFLAPDSASPLPVAPAPQVALPRLAPDPAAIAEVARRCAGRRGVIVAGAEPLPAEPLIRLAEALDWPLLAEPLSGLRWGSHPQDRLVSRSDLILRGPIAPPNIVLRFGAFPVAKAIGQWLTRAEEQIVVSGDSRWPDPARSATMLLHADPALLAEALIAAAPEPAPTGWRVFWHGAERRAAALAQRLAPREAGIVTAALAALPPGGLLFVANSMSVRDVDAFSGTAAKPLSVLCNRGLSGIDGTLATFFGALASGRFPAGLVLTGDLAFLHDLGGLAAGQDLPVPAGIVLLDNGGGGIFDYLPQTRLPEFTAGWITPQRADFAAAAQVWGHGYHALPAEDPAPGLAAALAAPGVSVLHFALDRADSVERHRALWAACCEEKWV